MADPYGNYQANQGLLSGPGLNPQGIDPELLRQITGLLSQTGPTPGLALPAGNMGYGVLQDAATAGKYAMGNPDRLTTDQIIPSVANSAMALGAGGMPMAEAGAAGIFGGKLTKDPAAFARMGEGSEMAASGASPNLTYYTTGTWRGPDKLSRYEIPDAESVLTKPALKSINEGRYFEGKLGDFLDHPELYQAYPHLAETPVSFNPSGIHGGAYTPPTGNFSPPNHSIMVGGNDPAQVRSVLLHEVQHAVQSKEGFTPGWSKEGASIQAGQLANEASRAGMPIEKVSDFRQNFNPWDAYRRAAGEVEARAVQSRRDIPPEGLSIYPPLESMRYEMPQEKWIVRQPLGILGYR